MLQYVLLICLTLFSSLSWSQNACRDLFVFESPITDVQSKIENEIENHRVNMKMLNGPTEALAAKLLAIRQAKFTIDIAVYQLPKDETGYLFLNELHKAAERGVRIRLLVDSVGSLSFSHTELEYLLRGFSKNRPEIKLANLMFHPKPAYARLMSMLRGETSFKNWIQSGNNRVHEKILLVDAGTSDSIGIFGSANMSNDATGLGDRNQSPTKEIEAIIRPSADSKMTPVDLEFTSYFESLYDYIGNHRLWDRSPDIFDFSGKRMQKKYSNAIAQANETLDLQNHIEKMKQADFLNKNLSPSDFELVHELPNLIRKTNVFTMKWFRWGKRQNESSVVRSLSKRMLNAQRRIEIVSPYFLITQSDIRKIERLMLKKPDLEFYVYINSFTNIDHKASCAAFEEFVGPKLAAIKANPLIGERLKIKVYMGDQNSSVKTNFFHMKAIRVDDEFWIGSHNLDYRSFRLNSEVGAWMNSTTGTEDISKAISEIDQFSIEWGSPAWQAIRERNPVFSDFQKFFSLVSRLFGIHLML